MDTQERIERAKRVFADTVRVNEDFTWSARNAVVALDRLTAALWGGFMELSEDERDKRNPTWREDYAEWSEHLWGGKPRLRIIG